jgi:ABC-2 type transport system permease protein
MLNSVFLKTLRDNRQPIFWFSLGLIFISFYLMYFYPFISRQIGILKVIESLPPVIRNLIGDTAKLATPEGFFNVQPFSILAPLVFLFFAISRGVELIAGEFERGTLEILLTIPFSRARIMGEKFSALLLSLLWLAVVFWIAMTTAAWIFSVNLSAARLAEAIFSCCLLGLCFTSLTLLISSLTLRKRLSVGVVSGYAIVAYLVNAYAPMVPALQTYQPFSLFYYYNGNSPIINGIDIIHVLFLIICAAMFFLLAMVLFNRKDICA